MDDKNNENIVYAVIFNGALLDLYEKKEVAEKIVEDWPHKQRVLTKIVPYPIHHEN